MVNGVILSEQELSIAKNSIERHIVFLEETVNSYITLIAGLVENEMVNTLTKNVLPNISDEMKKNLEQICFEALKLEDIIRRYKDEVINEDNFCYPDAEIYDISAKLAALFK